MYRRYYTIEMVEGSGRFPKEYDNYRDAYIDLCKEAVRELENDYPLTLYRIKSISVSDYGGSINTSIQDTWK